MALNFFIVCTFAFLIQSITARSCSKPSSISSSCVSIDIPDNGGPLTVTSVGPIAPSGIALATDLGLNGDLEISGALPYLSAVAFEGQFATKSSSPLSYSCGDCVAITQEIANGNPVSIASAGCGCGR